MKFFWVLAVLAVGVCAAHAQDPTSRGRALVREFCSPCHAIGKSGNSPHRSAPPFRTLGQSFDLDQFPRRLERGILAKETHGQTLRLSPPLVITEDEIDPEEALEGVGELVGAD